MDTLKQSSPKDIIRKSDQVYFPNLNGLRFIAALSVVVSHVVITNHDLGYEKIIPVSNAYIIGRLGVILFFVLSGFLITYLLLKEEKKIGEISVKKFYIRRLLRIWPLYYLIVLFSFFIVPYFLPDKLVNPDFYTYFSINLALFLFFLPNVANTFYPGVGGASQAWSIGVEEQFYLIWPVLFRRIKNKLTLILCFIAVYELVKFVGFRLFKKYIYWNDTIEMVREFYSKSFNIQCMAIGALFAYFLFKEKRRILTFIFSKYTQYFTIILTLFLIGSGVYIRNFNDEVFSVLFAIIIINAAANPKNLINLEYQFLNYLGKISYGIYMYHSIVILFYKKVSLNSNSLLIDYVIVVFFTIIISTVSYEYFEKFFIKLKSKYSVIKSGDMVAVEH